MKILQILGAALACATLAGCLGSSSRTSTSPSYTESFQSAPHTANDLLRIGDKITVRLAGVPDGGYVTEIQVPESGDITLPYLTSPIHAGGRNVADLEADITALYKNDKIYSNPQVTVLPEERFINVSGDVRSPSRVIYTPDSTLLSTIISCGGFDEYANKRAVRITRGKQLIVIDAVYAQNTPGADPPVYPGDQIYVPRTIF